MADYPATLPPADLEAAGRNHGQGYDELFAVTQELNTRHRRRARFGGHTGNAGAGFGFDLSGLNGVTATGTGSGSGTVYTLTSAASGGSQAALLAGASTPQPHTWLPEGYWFASLSSLAAVRFLAGVSHAFTDSDDPQNGGTLARQYAGVQFSSVRGDANWKFACNTNGGQVLVDSGIAADTGWHTFGFRFLAADLVRVSVDDTYSDLAFAQAAAVWTMNLGVSAFTQAAAAKAISVKLLAGSTLAAL